MKLRRPKLKDFIETDQKHIVSGCGCRDSNVVGGAAFEASCNKHDMHWQSGTGWLFPILAVFLSVFTGNYNFLLLWFGEFMWGNFLLFCRCLLDADDQPSIVQSIWHVLLAFFYLLVLTISGIFTYSYTIIGWHKPEEILGYAYARADGKNPRRSINEVVRSWFGK